MTPIAQRTEVETHQAITAMAAKLEKYEERIRSLEDDRLKVKSWVALIMFIGSVAAFLIGKFWPG